MTSDQFTYWLQGYFEIENPKELNETQVQIIKDHLQLVFKKVTPQRVEQFNEANTCHSGLNIEAFKSSIPYC